MGGFFVDNYEPKIRDNYVAFQNDSSIVIDVFAGVRQRDGDVLTISVVSNPVNGIVPIEADRTVGYAPDRQYHGVGTFSYTIDDEHGLTSPAAVNAPVTPVNDRPVFECSPETGADEFQSTVPELSAPTDADATGRMGQFDCALFNGAATQRCSRSLRTHLLTRPLT